MEVAPGIHRIDSPLGARFMAQYVLTGDARTLLFDTGLPDTPPTSCARTSTRSGSGSRRSTTS